MRVPQQRATRPSIRATQPSQTYVAGGSTGPQGTPGGRARKPGGSGRKMIVGQEMYLWILVLIEIAMIGGFRKYFRRFHGG